MAVLVTFWCSLAGGLGWLAAQDPRISAQEELRRALSAKNYAEVERLAHAIIQKNESDAVGWFYLGYARAAQERYGDAVGAYAQSLSLGLEDYKVHYQLAYSAHRAGHHGLAEKHFGHALEARKDDADALYYLAVSRLELKKDAAAEASFSRLLESPSRWEELARFHRGLARQRQGRQAEAQEDWRWVLARGQDPELKSRVQDLLEQQKQPAVPTVPPPKEKPWSVLFYEKAGYDSNVLRLPETSVSTRTEEGDVFLTSFATGSLRLADADRLTARLSLLDVTYADLGESNLDAVLAALESATPLGRSLSLETSAHGELFYLDRESLFRRGGLKGALRYEAFPRLLFRGGLAFMAKDFRDGELEFLDSTDVGGFLEGQLDGVAGPWTRATLRYELDHESADADDQSFFEHRFTLGLHFRFWEVLTAKVEGFSRWRFHEEADRVLGRTREDRRLGARVTLSYPILDALHVFLELEAERNASTLDPFDYDREVAALGVFLFF